MAKIIAAKNNSTPRLYGIVEFYIDDPNTVAYA